MGQSKIKKERDYKYPILSSMWPDIYIVRKKKGQDFIFFFHQTWEKNT